MKEFTSINGKRGQSQDGKKAGFTVQITKVTGLLVKGNRPL